MSIGQDEYSGHFEERAGSKADGDDGIVIPGSAPPLGTERTDVNPNDEAGIDELPNNDADTPQDHDTNGLMEVYLTSIRITPNGMTHRTRADSALKSPALGGAIGVSQSFRCPLPRHPDDPSLTSSLPRCASCATGKHSR